MTLHLISSLMGVVALCALVYAVASWISSSSSNAEQKLKRDQESRRMRGQPWDAHGADGRSDR